MFRFIRVFFKWIGGIFSRKTDALYENEDVIAQSFDDAISKGQMNLTTAKNAVATLIGQSKAGTIKVKELGDRLAKLNEFKQGAQVAMQRRVDTLRGQGKSKEEILGDAEFLTHKSAFDDVSSTIAEVQKQFDEKDADLKKLNGKLATLKMQLQKMQRHGDNLKQEKEEAVADVAAAKQRQAVDDLIAGIPQDNTDADLLKARQARERVVNRADISAELNSNDAKTAESEYLRLAQSQKNNNELDKLLNWGDEKKEDTLSPAKLPE